MRYKAIGPEALLALAAHTLRSGLLPDLPAEKRYIGAMIANAIDIAARGLDESAETVRWELLDRLYDDGEGSLQQLARDIRAGTIAPETHPDLPDQLTRLLVSELSVANPRFLASRGLKPR